MIPPRGRKISVTFEHAGRKIRSTELRSIDRGQILEIHGLNLPSSFECHFSKDGGTAWRAVGSSENGVSSVPFYDDQMKTGGIITAYIYLHETEDDGETEYEITIPIKHRPDVTPAEPTPVQQDVIAQAISALNNAVTVTTANVGITEANKNASAEHAQDAYEYADDASRSASSAHESETNAEQARIEAVSARDRAIEAKDTAHSEAQYAHSYAESAHTDAQSAGQSATSAQNSATSAQRSASFAQQYASTATAKASEAMQSAQSASQSAQTASQSAQSAQQSATQANTYATSASASATSATASEANASASATSAQESAESAQASADRAEQEADRWYEFLPVDSASGSIAHFTDGAKDVPVKALSVSLEPIQSGSGDPSPDNVRPITGHTQVAVNRTGKNLLKLDESEMVSSGFTRAFPNPIPCAGQYKLTCQNRFGASENYMGCAVVFRNEVGGSGIGGYYAGYAFGNTEFTGVTTTITEEMANAKYIVFLFRASGATFSVLDNAQIQIEASSTASSYETYTAQSITIPLGDTVYGGTLDVVNGVLTVDRAYTLLNNPDKWIAATGVVDFRYDVWIDDRKLYNDSYSGLACSYVPCVYGAEPYGRWTAASGYVFGIKGSDITLAQVKADASAGNIAIAYTIAQPITVPLTANQMTTLLGINNIWSDSGDVSVDYRADVQLYIKKMIANALNA